MKTKLEIIEETVAAYSDPSNRAKNGNWCRYLDDKGRKCAVGRCFREDAPIGAINSSESAGLLFAAFTQEKVLRTEYLGHENSFWRELQSFHDSDGNFVVGGISESGIQHIQALKDSWT